MLAHELGAGRRCAAGVLHAVALRRADAQEAHAGEGDAERLGEAVASIQSHTQAYLQVKSVSDLVDEVTSSLNLRKPRITFKRISKYTYFSNAPIDT